MGTNGPQPAPDELVTALVGSGAAVVFLSLDAIQHADGGAGGPLLPKPNLVPEAQTYFHRTKSGYAIFARYPLSRLNGAAIKPGSKIGFDVAINDNDGTNYRKNQHIWAGYNQNQAWYDVGTGGALMFR